MDEFIPVSAPLFLGNEKKYLIDCVDSGWVSSEGSYVKKFEESFARYTHRKYGVSVCNGTLGLDLAFTLLDIQKGDEVLLPSFTIISCVLPIVKRDAIPVTIDCDQETWNLDATQVESLITPKTKAIVLPHIYGLCSDIDVILELAKKYNLKVIEDACQAHGQFYKDRPCGSFGDISVLSFYANKSITTGEGGMLLMNDPVLYEKAKSQRNLCFLDEKRFYHEELGQNLRISNLQAALGLAQLENIEELLLRKRNIGLHYLECLADLNSIQLPLESTSYTKNQFWAFGICLEDDLPVNVETVRKKLYEANIGTRPFFYPIHLQPVLIKKGLFKGVSHPISSQIARRGFYLPSGAGLSLASIQYISKTLKRILREYM